MNAPLSLLANLRRLGADSPPSWFRGSFPTERTQRLPAWISHRAVFRLSQWLLDLAAVLAAWEIARRLAISLAALVSAPGSVAQAGTIPTLGGAVALWAVSKVVLAMRSNRLYARQPIRLSGSPEPVVVLWGLTLTGGLFSSQAGHPLPWLFLALFLAALLVTRMASQYASAMLGARWGSASLHLERVAVVGRFAEAVELWEQLRAHGKPQIVGIIPARVEPSRRQPLPVPCLGELGDLGSIINHHELDRLIVVERHLPPESVDHCQTVAARMGLTVTRMLSAAAAGSVSLGEYHGLRVVDIKPPWSATVSQAARRILDPVCAGVVLVLLGPLLAILAVLTRMTSRGPILYRDRRVGRGGRHFTLYKFRSMQDEPSGRALLAERNEQNGHLFKMRSDPRVTPLGAFLRRYSLDELPQLFNVLRGEMSLVGPRPLPAEDLEPDGSSRKHAHWARERAEVPPGMTGLWQVRGRSDLPFEEMVKFDLLYVRNRSWALDVRILAETPRVVFSGRGAY